MPFNGKAATRKNLPPPFKACYCDTCQQDRHTVQAKIVKRQNRLNPSIKDCRLRIRFDWTISPMTALDFHSTSKKTILRLPDEILLRIFGFAGTIPTTICLALSCKRLCRIYLDTLKHRSARIENRLWSSLNGFWKPMLIENLSKGWVPRDQTRFCWGCWYFHPYGRVSRDFWRAKIPALIMSAETQTFRIGGVDCCYYPTAAHGTGERVLPVNILLHDGFKSMVQRMQDLFGIRVRLDFVKQAHDSDDLQQYQENWEVRFWLGEQDVPGVATSLEKDKRIRCPGCVLANNPLRLLERGMKLARPMRQPDLPEILEHTLSKRASLQGYKWDPRHKVFSMVEGMRGLTGCCRDRPKKKWLKLNGAEHH